ncbi:MAG: hypothetical protein IT343_10615 [Candidatus Melainabacteria bacterium]|nr:hypothetical protein [Candidatus Melainabacteria bacterium]
MTDDKNSDLNIWLARVKQAQTRKDVFRILDEFRKHEWTDVQCQTMSHLYIRMIDLMPPEEGADEVEVASVAIADDTAGSAVSAAGAAAAAGVAAGAGTGATGAEEGGEPKKAVINEGPVWYEKM